MSAAFTALRLSPEIIKACRKQGFKVPTPIQAMVVPAVAKGRDVVVEAKTGSGKTLAYGWPLLDREPLQTAHPETIIVVPTRELAQQIEADLTLSAGSLHRPVVTLVGRGGLDRQQKSLEAGANIVVGTLGRIEEALARGILRLDFIRTVVLDEVDELLKGGFSRNIALLLGQVPREHQTLLFSASIQTEIEVVAKKFTKDAARLSITAAREQATELSHRVLFTTVDERIPDLIAYLKSAKPYQAVIFCGTRHETEEVNLAIREAGLVSEFLHGELSPLKRRQLLEKVRSGDLPLLIASDLAARGLDLPGVDVVVNYSLPKGPAPYLHRAGRTGRAGRPGTVVSMLIEQQRDVYEKLKGTFPFQSIEVFKSGKMVKRALKTREARDLEFRKLPEQPDERKWTTRKPAPKAIALREAKALAAPKKKTTGKKPRPASPGKKAPSRKR